MELKERHEIVSLVRTLSDGGHLHTSLSDSQGRVIGGHVMEYMIVFTTAEIIIGDCIKYLFEKWIHKLDSKNLLLIEINHEHEKY